ncbi:N-acetylmuramoyl-L-alanine amidase [Streptomyces sp. SID2888]|uniref:N-acetylmuramoyl-L-alanine amidase n=1 Tax=Streptomyces sp. SID2888 TaxID=2690256 RepID=UPI001EFFD796|nr:N-acetylmuramoyl-L-alanine amidase [Streptomyces sp. SID2888]
MARMPGAVWRPITINHTKGGQSSVRGVVVHIMDGSYAGTDSWFRNHPEAQASSHFGTSRAGELCQWVDTADRAWAQAGGNTSWLSVENEGKGGDDLTSAQLDRNAEVLAWAHETYGVPLQVTSDPNGRGLGYHAMGGSAWGGHPSCPGSRVVAQLAEIVARAKKIVGGTAPTGSTYTVKSGDTLSGIGAKVGVPWETLATLNGIKAPYVIHPGDVLKLQAPAAPKPYSPPPFPTGLAPDRATPSARTLQRALKSAGFMPTSVAEADNYGPQTQKAVAAFHNAYPQYRSQGVSYDPAIGPKGWAALFTLAYGK